MNAAYAAEKGSGNRSLLVVGKGSDCMEYIRVTKDNLEKEHICCAISNNKDVQVSVR
jgi:hypothetical protein